VRRHSHGFTLVELAVALAIIGLLIGMLVVPLGTQVDQQRIGDTQRQANLAIEAVLGFAVTNGRLPCPATPGTANTVAGAGTESRVAGPPATCALTEGVLPWNDLGLPEADAWGRRFTYRVTPAMADDPTGGLQATFALSDTGSVTITSGGVTIASGVAAVVVSHGKNGLGAYQTTGAQLTGAAGDELENADADGTFVSRTHDPAFDDVVAWLSANVLKSRMVASNRLP
jgi:prepilin-type N-terminal cleavage/methylation domain-containing protein